LDEALARRLGGCVLLRARLGLGAGWALKFRLGFIDRLGEKILLIIFSQAVESHMEDVAFGTSM
jgi:hypothetical protein